MKIKDKNLNEYVWVLEKDCLNKTCYWPRPDPGVFTQGVGYKTRKNKLSVNYLCGTREARGCPNGRSSSIEYKEEQNDN